jgi:hypothetical protein
MDHHRAKCVTVCMLGPGFTDRAGNAPGGNISVSLDVVDAATLADQNAQTAKSGLSRKQIIGLAVGLVFGVLLTLLVFVIIVLVQRVRGTQ